MARITITQFSSILSDPNGNSLPIGGKRSGGQSLGALGASTPMATGTMMVRIATDTACVVNGYGAGSVEFMPAGSVEFFPAVKDQIFTFEAA